MDIIAKDCEFFQQNSIIDYSLLVGINNRTETPALSGNETPLSDRQALAADLSPFDTLNNSMVSLAGGRDKKFYEAFDGGL